MKLLIIKLSDIGDVLTATPALRALRQSYPSAQLTALVPPHSADILLGSPLVDEVLLFPKGRYDSLTEALQGPALAYAAGFIGGLRRRHFDWAILLHHLTTWWGTLKYAALLLGCRAPWRAGLDNGRGWFLTHRVPDHGFGHCHEVEYWLQVVGTLGATTQDLRLEMVVDEGAEGFARRHLRSSGKQPLIALHPGSGSYSLARRWPLEGFAAVARELRRRWGSPLVLVGGPGEQELGQQLEARLDFPVRNLIGKTSLKELAAVLRRCRLLVANDGGVMHLATAVGTPVVAIFGPSNHRAWGPWSPPASGPAVRVVRLDLPCSPCFYPDHRLGRRDGCDWVPCLQALSPAMVVQAALELLADHG